MEMFCVARPSVRLLLKHCGYPLKNRLVSSTCLIETFSRSLTSFPYQKHYCDRKKVTGQNSKLTMQTLDLSSGNLSESHFAPGRTFWSCSNITPRRHGMLSLMQLNRKQMLSSKAVVEASPSFIQPYLRLMRIDRPIGVWLVFLPCAWSISLAVPGGQLPDAKMLALFAMGSFFMRGAGCIINDMWDKDFDSKVARTRDRPLASGELSRFNALCFLSIPLSISLSVLLTFNWNTIFLGCCSMIPCIMYPLMKRVTYWPQAFLGITTNWGIMIAWSATNGFLDWPCLTLYLSGVLWTVTYDTIYSHQDKEDDIKVGVKSTALRFGDSTKYWLTGFSSVITAGFLGTGFLTDQTWPYYLGVALFSTHLGHQIYSVDLNDPNDCGEKFRSNRNLGLVFWLMILFANLLKTDDKSSDRVEKTSQNIL